MEGYIFYKLSLLSRNISKVSKKTISNIKRLQDNFNIPDNKIQEILDGHSLALYYLSKRYLSEDFQNVVKFFCDLKEFFVKDSNLISESISISSNFDENYINCTKQLDHLFTNYIKKIAQRFNLKISFNGIIYYNESSDEYIPITSRAFKITNLFRNETKINKAVIKNNKLIIPIFRHYSKQAVSYFVLNLENKTCKDYHKAIAALDLGFFSIEKEIKELITGTVEKIATKGIKDELTDVYKRRYGAFKIKESLLSLERDESSLVFMVDIDNFKLINDTLGHQVGDETLKEIANILKTAFRRYEDVIVRYGGDEFIVCVTQNDNSPLNLNNIKERLLNKLDSFKMSHKENVYKSLGFSVGIEKYKFDNQDDVNTIYNKIIKKADEKMYKAKSLKHENSVIIIE